MVGPYRMHVQIIWNTPMVMTQVVAKTIERLC